MATLPKDAQELFSGGSRFLAGALTVFADIAHRSILPPLVPRESIADAHPKLSRV